MADILGSFAEGFQRGRAQFAANEAARAEAAEKQRKAALEDAKFQLQVAGESRLAQGAAETAWGEIDKAINDENWDPSKINQARSAAMRFDQTYGNIWKGGSALKYVEESLHLGPQKVSGAVEDGKQGPPAPDTETKHPLWGYVSPEQKMAADERQRKALTAEYAPQLQNDALDYLNRNAMRGGMIDPDLAVSTLFEWQAATMAQTGMDPKVVMDVMDNMFGHLKTVFEAQADASGVGAAYREEKQKLSKDVSSWIENMVGTPTGLGTFSFDSSQQALRVKAEQLGQTMIDSDVPLGLIKRRLSQMLVDPNTGAWQSGGPTIRMHAAELAKAPPLFDSEVAKKYQAGLDPIDWVPVWDSGTNTGVLANVKTGEEIVVYPVSVDIGDPMNTSESMPPGAKRGVSKNPEAPSGASRSATAPKPEKPKEPQVSIEELKRRRPSSLNGVEFARVSNSMTGPEFVAWMRGEGR